MAQAASAWDKEFEPEPEPGSPAAEVYGDIWGMIDPSYFLNLSELGQRRILREICEQQGWSWSQVARVIRHRAIAAGITSNDYEIVEFTRSGIPIFTPRFAEPQPLCPFKTRHFHLGFWSVRHVDKKCGSLSERQCGPDQAERLLRKVRIRIQHLGQVHVAEAQWNEGLSNLMGQRRSSTGINTFYYRDVNDSVSFVADGPITGRVPPRSSNATRPDEAMEWLTPRLWVPGHHDHSFSQGWSFSPSPESRIHVSLDGLTDASIEKFHRMASSFVERTFGIRPGLDQLSPEHWPTVRMKLIAMREYLRKQQL